MAIAEHEKLAVYHKARHAAREVETIAAKLPPARRDLQDQLRRGSASVVLNIAEGASEFRRPEKARIYRLARREAAECLAGLDLVRDLVQDAPNTQAARESLLECLSMLGRLIQVHAGR